MPLLAVVGEQLYNQICPEVLAWLRFDDGDHLIVGVGMKDDSACLPAVGAGDERAEVDAVSVDQSVAMDSHLTVNVGKWLQATVSAASARSVGRAARVASPERPGVLSGIDALLSAHG